jgi:ABC-type Fe3+/spermidine/putrescine transport system ATPase subunit
MVMADRIVIMDGGRIAQQGTPEEVFNRPASAFVAAFMGAENVLALSGSVAGDEVVLDAGPASARAVLATAGRPLSGDMFEARFRAEGAELLPGDGKNSDGKDSDHTADALVLRGHVEAASYPGGVWRHSVHVGGDTLLIDAARPFAQGAAVRVRIAAPNLFLFNSQDADPHLREGSQGDGRDSRARETLAA